MKKNILIIDDFENTLFVTGLTLQTAGYEVVKSISASEALKILDSAIRIDLIITDYNMPNMNGLTLIKEIKNLPKYRNTPIFVLSTEAKEEIKQNTLNAGATAWIKKPFKTEKLIEFANRALK